MNVRHGNNEKRSEGREEEAAGDSGWLGFSCFVEYVGLVRGVADMQSS